MQSLRFTLDFARCLMEVAGARGPAVVGEPPDAPHPSVPQPQSVVADQISSLSREWRYDRISRGCQTPSVALRP